MSNVAVFIDVQNLYHSSKSHGGSKISYPHLLKKIGEGRTIVSATAYAAHKNYKASQSFYHALEASGVVVKSQKIHVTPDKRVVPVHCDVELSVDALVSVYQDDKVDCVVICSGNGNFSHLVKALVDDQVNVEVWSFSGSTADVLKNSTGLKFVEIPNECLLSNVQAEEKSDAVG